MEQFPKHVPIPRWIERKSKLAASIHAISLVLFLAIVEILLYFTLDARIHAEIDMTQRLAISQMTTRLTDTLTQQQNEFLFMAKSPMARQCLIKQTNEECANILTVMKTMMEVNPSIDHLRILDHHGMEVVRMNRDPVGRPICAPKKTLQDKSNKPYFIGAMKTEEDKIYLSRLDLNMENGEVEEPRKPVLRFGKAIHSVSGHPIGAAVVNFKTRQLLSRLNVSSSRDGDHWYMLDSKGYYLRGIAPEKEFSFMFPDAPQTGFYLDYPNAWKHFQQHPDEPYLDDNGKFYFGTIRPVAHENRDAANSRWVLVMHVSPKTLAALNTLLCIGLIIGALLLSPILAVLGWRNGRFHVKQQWYLKELARNAITDNMTGLLNHRGLMEKLSPAVSLANRRNGPLVLIFVDVNDLKDLNDQMGHRMGDRLIIGAAQALLETVRESDIVGRLGGDEFIVGLVDCDIPHAIRVMQRVDATMAQMGHEYTGKPWTVSWGCTERQPHDTAELMISRADKQMYARKSEYKTGRNSTVPKDETRPN